MNRRYNLAVWVIALTLVLVLAGSVLAADQYVIGAEDVLNVSFWQDPSLNANVKVSLDGIISLDIIGQIEAAGKTTEELQNDIVRLMSRLNKNISQSTVRVAEFNYNYVYVIGQVGAPGKKAFEEIPDLWTLINESGGIGPQGDLSRVSIIRGGDDAGKIEVVNVSQAIADETLDRLPKVRRQDTIEIPRMPGQVLSSEIARSTERKNLIYVIGAVNSPGPIAFDENLDVAEVLAMAGGPSPDADLSKIQLIIKDGSFAQTIRFDLDKYAHSGKPARYIMQKEDMCLVPSRRPGFFSSSIGTVMTALGVVSTVFIIYDRLQSN